MCEELTVELATETAILFGSVAAICGEADSGVGASILDAIITPPFLPSPLLHPHSGALVRVVRRAGRLTRDTGHHLMAEDTALLVQCLSYSSYFHPYSFYLILSSTSLLMFINVFTSEGIQQFKKLHNHLAKQLLKEEFWAINCKIQFPGI